MEQRRVRFQRRVGQRPLDVVKHTGEIVLHHRTGQGVGLVGQHRQTHPSPFQRVQQGGHPGIRGSLVLFVLAVVSGKLHQRLGQFLLPQPVGGKPGHQIGDAVAHHVLELVHRVGGPAVGLADVVSRICQIVNGIQKGAV